ncbi:MAG: hypothetical protein OHK0046_52170 [Anaerolineae bacterium]
MIDQVLGIQVHLVGGVGMACRAPTGILLSWGRYPRLTQWGGIYGDSRYVTMAATCVSSRMLP